MAATASGATGSGSGGTGRTPRGPSPTWDDPEHLDYRVALAVQDVARGADEIGYTTRAVVDAVTRRGDIISLMNYAHNNLRPKGVDEYLSRELRNRAYYRIKNDKTAGVPTWINVTRLWFSSYCMTQNLVWQRKREQEERQGRYDVPISVLDQWLALWQEMPNATPRQVLAELLRRRGGRFSA